MRDSKVLILINCGVFSHFNILLLFNILPLFIFIKIFQCLLIIYFIKLFFYKKYRKMLKNFATNTATCSAIEKNVDFNIGSRLQNFFFLFFQTWRQYENRRFFNCGACGGVC
jgi:hypothetical protein